MYIEFPISLTHRDPFDLRERILNGLVVDVEHAVEWVDEELDLHELLDRIKAATGRTHQHPSYNKTYQGRVIGGIGTLAKTSQGAGDSGPAGEANG